MGFCALPIYITAKKQAIGNLPLALYYLDGKLSFMSPLLYSILVEIAPTQCLQQESPEMLYYNISSFNEFFKKVSFIRLVIGQQKSNCSLAL